MTADDTPETVLESVRRQAFRYLRKPFPPNTIVEVVNEACGVGGGALVRSRVGAAGVAGTGRAVHARNGRSHPVVRHAPRGASLPEDVHEAVAHAFRELLTNAIEWGGKLDPNRKVRISCVSTKKMLLYGSPTPARDSTSMASACGDFQPRARPDSSSPRSRGARAPARRFRSGDDPVARRRIDL